MAINIPYKRVPIPQFTAEHICTRKYDCDHCGAQIWGTYQRIVVRVASARYPALEVVRRCGACM